MIKNEQSILDLQQNGIRGIGTEQTAAYEIESDAIAEAKRRVAMYEMLLADLEKL
jgi:hypothetical protein